MIMSILKRYARNNNGRYDSIPENGTRDPESFQVSGQGSSKVQPSQLLEKPGLDGSGDVCR